MRQDAGLFFVYAVAAACLFAVSFSAAEPKVPKPLEDATKIERPTVCYSAGRAGGLWFIDWDGTNNRLWLGEDLWFMGPAHFGPRGKRAAFVVFSRVAYTIFVLNLETNRVENLTDRLLDRQLTLTAPRWSPDGQWLVCRGSSGDGRVKPLDIYKLNVSSAEVINLTNSPDEDDDWPSFSPDGKKILFSSARGDQDNRVWDIYIMDADGRNEVNLTNHPAVDSTPEWSPDGKRIAFQSTPRIRSNGKKGHDIYLMNADGSGVERLTTDARWKTLDSWSPDGKWILTGIQLPWDDNRYQIHRVHVETKQIVKLTRAPMSSSSASWVLAGKGRFLSVNPAGKKHTQWGEVKGTEAPQKENAAE